MPNTSIVSPANGQLQRIIPSYSCGNCHIAIYQQQPRSSITPTDSPSCHVMSVTNRTCVKIHDRG